MKQRNRKRTGALAVETAVVLPVMFLLLFGLIIGGTSVFRWQQVACQAREAARWISVRGAEWAAETGKPSPSESDIRHNAVQPHTAGMAGERLSLKVEWIDGGNGDIVPWDTSCKCPRTSQANGNVVANRVRVTVTYAWSPRLTWFKPLTLRSVSEMPLQF